MAMRRRFPFPRRRAMPASKAFRTFSRKKLNWVCALNNVCDSEFGEIAACSDGAPPPPVQVPLLTTGQIVGGYDYRSQGEDSVICRRIRGKLLFTFTPSPPATLTDSTGIIIFRAGLKVADYSYELDSVLDYNPLQGDEDGGDYCDGRWLKMWEVITKPRAEFTLLPPTKVWAPRFEDCVTHAKTSLFGLMVSGGGAFGSAPLCATSTPLNGVDLGGECVTCEEDTQTSVTQTNAAPSFVINLERKKPIRLKENQNLIFYWSAIMPSLTPVDLGYNMVGGIRCLLEK